MKWSCSQWLLSISSVTSYTDLKEAWNEQNFVSNNLKFEKFVHNANFLLHREQCDSDWFMSKSIKKNV